MIALLGIIKNIPAAVLLALAGTNHVIEDIRPMAETIMAPVLIEARIAQYIRGNRQFLDRYECVRCGMEFVSLRSNAKKSGCICTKCGNEKRGNSRATHGFHRKQGQGTDKRYNVYSTIKARCYNPNNKSYKDYGGRGITICDEWQTFEGFMQWDKFNEWSDGLQIDRIDNNGDYSPENCRWVTRQANCQNRRTSSLNQEDVRLIRIFHGSGVPNVTVDKLLGVYIGATYSVIHKGAWGNA